MADEINLKKSTIFIVLAVIVVGGFLLFAFKNIIFGAANSEVIGNVVKTGDEGSNNGDAQVVDLGIANYNYYPNVITVQSGKKVKIVGNMNQLSGCLKAFRIPGLGISKLFKQGDNVLEFTPTSKGTYGFSCTMGMGTGTLIVK